MSIFTDRNPLVSVISSILKYTCQYDYSTVMAGLNSETVNIQSSSTSEWLVSTCTDGVPFKMHIRK